ncbi:MAG: ATP-dependent helicase HrpB, partial [Gemmatimonadetes bacterium]|nr:ATP-dependent helicase HrpB [Gemmatimonadota bacterium]
LETVRVSLAAAAQRAGRAGRTAPGIAYRLWRADEEAQLPERGVPEILEADLTGLALDLAVAGVHDPLELRWMDPPPAAGLSHARGLLRQLGALDDDDRITPHGRAVAGIGLHPRLAHMLLRGRGLGDGATACVVAALIDERDVLRREGVRDADLAMRVSLVAGREPLPGVAVDRDALRRVRERARALRAELGVRDDAVADEHATGWLLALAYPDRVGERREGEGDRYLLRNGHGAVLHEAGSLAGSPWLVAADLDGRLPHARIWLAAALLRDDVLRVLGDQVVREDVVEWDAPAGAVSALRRERLGAIVLRESPLREVRDEQVTRVLLGAIRRGDGLSLPWTEAVQRWRERVAFARTLDARWPELGDAALDAGMDAWLLPHLAGLRRRAQVERLDLLAILGEMLEWEQRRDLDRLAPTHVVVPTGSRIPVDYADPSAPSIAVRLQELFGLAETPRVGDGRVPLVLRLLSPAHRPVQVTRDLAGFWRSSYFEVRKDLRGRYPKHEWPDDPMSAAPTRRARRRGD